MAWNFRDQAADLLACAADAAWRCSADLRVDQVELLRGEASAPRTLRIRGRRLDDLAKSAVNAFQSAHLLGAVEQRARLTDVALTLQNADGGLDHYLFNASPVTDDAGTFGGYRGILQCWSELPFDNFRRGELVEARRREDRAQANEAILRRDAEVLLSALQVLIEQSSLQEKCRKLFALFAPILRYDDAVVLRRGRRAQMVVAAASNDAVLGVVWPEGDVLRKTMKGEARLIGGKSLQDANLEFPAELGEIKALLLVPLQISSETAVLVIVAREEKRFASRHLALMRRLNLMAAKLLLDEDQKSALVTSAKLAAMGELLATIVHELNQPISIISMSASNARALLTRHEDPVRAVEKLDQILAATSRATEIARSVRELAYSDQSGGKHWPIHIETALRAVETIARIGVKNRNVSLSFEIAKDCPPILGNQTWLQQIVLNLINNARDAIAENDNAAKDRSEGKIVVYARESAGAVIVGVADNGGGVPDDLREKIFDPFFTLKAIGKGTGLGLALCRRLVTDMDGEIVLRNEDSGAVFEISFPPAEDAGVEYADDDSPASLTG
jgi:signal transduction histidine kinase